MDPIAPFTKKQYLNLETFRKNGEGVKTPVWFVREGETLYVMTMKDSGKVKRIRRNGTVNVAPCTASGKTVANWVAARACELTEAADHERVNRLLDKKYGLLKKLFFRDGTQGKTTNTVLEIKFIE